jgi:hypothetical protein
MGRSNGLEIGHQDFVFNLIEKVEGSILVDFQNLIELCRTHCQGLERVGGGTNSQGG